MSNRKALLNHPISVSCLSALAALVLRILGSTWRVHVTGANPVEASGGEAQIGVFWHRNALIASYLFRDLGFAVPVSQSRDGNLIAALLMRLGYLPPPRGSDSRGGSGALLSVARLVQAGTTVSIQSDGPRGPARRSKPGVVALSRITGAPITPVAISAAPCIRFDSWDGTLLPYPFARVRCDFAEPLVAAPVKDTEAEDEFREQIDHRLNERTDALDDELGFIDANR